MSTVGKVAIVILYILIYTTTSYCQISSNDTSDEIQVLKDQLNIALTKIESFESSMREMRVNMADQQNTIEQLRFELNQTYNKKVKPQPKSVMDSSFTVCPESRGTYNDGDLVIFDSPVTNIGGHFLTANSSYVAPCTGQYMFTISLTNWAGFRMVGALVKNGVEVVFVYNYDTSTYHTGTNLYFGQLNAGDAVWVKATHDNVSLEGGSMSTFSGLLIKCSE